MLYCYRIDISEGIDVNKAIGSKECIICHYWYFFRGFKFQQYVCNDCHDLLMMNLNNIDVLNIKNINMLVIVAIFMELAKVTL